jgi:hypothetical protein
MICAFVQFNILLNKNINQNKDQKMLRMYLEAGPLSEARDMPSPAGEDMLLD